MTVENVKATLTADAASVLDTTFGTPRFTAGPPLGTATVFARVAV